MKDNQSILIATGIFPPDIGGPATYSHLLLEQLPKHGWVVKILNFGDFRYLPKIFRHLAYSWQVFRFCKKYRIVYSQDPVSVGLPVCLACWLRGKKFILKIVGDYAWEQGSQRFGVTDLLDDFSVEIKKYYWQVKILKLIQTGVAKRAQKIIVPSNYLKNIVSNWGVDPEKIKVIYNAFDQPEELPSKDELKREMGLLSGPILVSAGRLVPWKGFDLLIDIVEQLREKYPELIFLIVGDGPDKKKLANKIGRLNLTSSVRLLGRLSQRDLLKYVKASDIFVLNTSYEGFSHQLLEVMWCGTPIITTAVGGNPELIKNDETGFLVRYENNDDWLSSIVELLDDDGKKDFFVRSAKERLNDFSRDKMINSLIKELL